MQGKKGQTEQKAEPSQTLSETDAHRHVLMVKVASGQRRRGDFNG